MLLRHPGRDAGAPISALGHITGVAQPLHEHRPRFGDTRQAPSAGRGLVGEAIAGERWHDDVEGVLGSATVGRGIGQRGDDFEEFDDRARPSVRQNDRQRIRVFRRHMQKVNSETVELRSILGNRVHASFKAAHVVAGSPILCERLHIRQRHAFGPVADRLLIRPAGCGKPSAQIVKRAGWNGQAEFRHRLRSGRHHDLRGLRLCCPRVGTSRRQPDRAEPGCGEQHAASRGCFRHVDLRYLSVVAAEA